jgi:hypothetical protein
MSLRTILLASVLLAIAVVPAVAQNQDVYDNGPTNGNEWAWLINFDNITSNSFTFNNDTFDCHGSCYVDGFAFVAWLFPGDVFESAEVSITSSEFGGTTYFDQNLNFTRSACFTNDFGFTACTETARFPQLTLPTGIYWLNVQNAAINTGDPVYWDQNDGPSLASNNSTGTIPSESFTLLGYSSSSSCPWCGYSPEPNSFVLFGSGFITLVAFASKKLIR